MRYWRALRRHLAVTMSAAVVITGLWVCAVGGASTARAAAPSWSVVDTGYTSACGVRSEGTLWCWAGDVAGSGTTARRPAQVGAATDWRAVSVGTLLACAVRADASGWCWGVAGDGALDVTSGTPVRVPGSWRALVVGHRTICGVRTGGALACWGSGAAGQLGTGGTADAAMPQRVDVAASWAAVSVGAQHVCATTASAALWCWGRNDSGQLGDGTRVPRLSPTRIGIGRRWGVVDAGSGASCAISRDDDLFCWGDNYRGSLGAGSSVDRFLLSPIRIGVAGGWASVAKGAAAGCATRTDGTLWCWGLGSSGTLGDGTVRNRAVPTRVGIGTGWTTVTMVLVACGIDAGHLHCWGSDSSGLLGTGLDVGAAAPAPRPVRMRRPVDVVATGQNTCVVTADQGLRCWGANEHGSVGDGTDVPRTKPVSLGRDWSTVAVGGSRSCALKVDASLWCWGSVVGDGRAEDRYTPTAVLPGTAWREVASGDTQSCGIQVDRSLWCWGSDNIASTRYSPTRVGHASTWVAVSVGGQHACAIRQDSTLWCWGQNGSGELGLGAAAPASRRLPGRVAGRNWTTVSAGLQHTCATRSDGTAWCWGISRDGRLGHGLVGDGAVASPVRVAGSTSWVSVTAGGLHTCGLGTDGRVSCWGSVRYGALGIGRSDATGRPQPVPPPSTGGGWQDVSAGLTHTCAVSRGTGAVSCWGYGPLGDVVVTGGDPIG